MRMQFETRSFGVQVDLCNCSRGSKSSSTSSDKPKGRMSSSPQSESEITQIYRNESSSVRRLGSSEDRVPSEDTVDRCTRPGVDPLESRRLLDEEEICKRRISQSSRTGSTSSPTNPYPFETRRQVSSTTRTSSSDSMSYGKRDSHQAYHIRRKLASFRSDSVFSDVTPIANSSSTSSQDPRKGSDPCEKTVRGSGSLSSLKPKESKWISLRKKLKINSNGSSSSATTSSSKKSLEQKDETEVSQSTPPIKQVIEKRSLFQRAKTLAILPVGKSRNESTEESRGEKSRHRKHQHQVQEPKELFNVGGEMNMIPLEFLININDLNISSK